MALPLIVAITARAQEMGFVESSVASVLVTAGAITVLFVPVITSIDARLDCRSSGRRRHRNRAWRGLSTQVWREHREASVAEERKFFRS